MEAGLEVCNNSGVLQVTPSYKNLRLTNKGTITLRQITNNGSISVDTGEGKIIAFKIPADRRVYVLPYTEGCWFYHPWDNSGDLLVTYYIFSYADIPEGNYFEVRNEKNEVCFSDTANFMKVLSSGSGAISDKFPYSWPDSNKEWTLGTYPYSVNTAIVIGKAATRTSVMSDLGPEGGTGNTFFYYYATGIRFDLSAISVILDGFIANSVFVGVTDFAGYESIQECYNFLVIDVTGY